MHDADQINVSNSVAFDNENILIKGCTILLQLRQGGKDVWVGLKLDIARLPWMGGYDEKALPKPLSTVDVAVQLAGMVSGYQIHRLNTEPRQVIEDMPNDRLTRQVQEGGRSIMC